MSQSFDETAYITNFIPYFFENYNIEEDNDDMTRVYYNYSQEFISKNTKDDNIEIMNKYMMVKMSQSTCATICPHVVEYMALKLIYDNCIQKIMQAVHDYACSDDDTYEQQSDEEESDEEESD